MWVDVSDLYCFYDSALGAVVQQILRHCLQDLWPTVSHQNVATYGYGIPYLELFRYQAARTMALMPAPLGAIHSQQTHPNLTVLCEETNFPLPDQSLDKLLIIHGLEYTSYPSELLREAWRVLVDGGQLIVVVPNRRGLWARLVNTPFGHGQPYTGHQLFALVEQNSFTPAKPIYCLYMPPAIPQFFATFYESIELFGRRWGKKLGGVVILEARKTVFAGTTKAVQRWRSHIFVPQQLKVK
jgi:SAM-dependent methyltransferase